MKKFPSTPDGRYFVAKGRLWRCSNPELPEVERQSLVTSLMDARRRVKAALKLGDPQALASARHDVDLAKVGLGERGPVWWADDAPDYTSYAPKNTPYGDWWNGLSS